MRLVRYQGSSGAQLGAVRGDRIVDLNDVGCRFSTMLALIEAGPAAVTELSALVDAAINGPALAEVRLLTPIERPGKYLAIGMNYANTWRKPTS